MYQQSEPESYEIIDSDQPDHIYQLGQPTYEVIESQYDRILKTLFPIKVSKSGTTYVLPKMLQTGQYYPPQTKKSIFVDFVGLILIQVSPHCMFFLIYWVNDIIAKTGLSIWLQMHVNYHDVIWRQLSS